MEIQKISDFINASNALKNYGIDDHTNEMKSIVRQSYLLLAAHIGEVHSKGKYKEKYGTIERWAYREFGWESGRQVYNYLNVYNLLTNKDLNVKQCFALPAPNSLRQALALAKQNLEPEELKEVYPMIFGNGKKVNEEVIVMTVQKWRESKKQEEAIQEENGFDSPEPEGFEEHIHPEISFEDADIIDESNEKPGQVKIRSFFTLDEWSELMHEEKLSILEVIPSKSNFNSQDTDSIEWARWSWNPVTGCKHECSYCYARDIANRFYEQGFAPSFYPGRLAAPYNMAIPQKAEYDLSFKNVFTCSMADLFGRWVPEEWIEAVLNVVRDNPDWNFLFLTKFPKRMAEFDIPFNAWMGTTVDCQARVSAAEKAFSNVNCEVKWLSVEPMLEDITFSNLEMFDWVVMGGSSQSNNTPGWAPPFDWVVNLHNQARAAGCMVYQKTNLFSGKNGDNWMSRLREWPGESQTERKLPDQFKYMKSIK